MKKTILVPGYTYRNGSDIAGFGVGINYLNFLHKFGKVRILTPDDEFVKGDLLFLPGGMDTASSNYGETPSFSLGHQDAHKEWFMKERLPHYIGKIPIFGVCLGMQQLAVTFGSTLEQHLMWHKDSDSRWSPAHYVFQDSAFQNGIIKKSVKEEIKEKKYTNLGFKVNSHHHQCVYDTHLSDPLQPLLFAEQNEWDMHFLNQVANHNSRIVEAFVHKELPIVGVQWHPEELYDRFSVQAMYDLLTTGNISDLKREYEQNNTITT